MKKAFALFLAVVMLISVCAFAETTPSKEIGGMTGTYTTTGSSRNVTPDEVEDGPTLYAEEEPSEIAMAEVEKLIKVPTVVEYFGNVTDIDGFPVSLAEMLDAKESELHVDELTDLRAFDFGEDCNDVLAELRFATPYEVDEVVAVMIGFVVEGKIQWTAFEGRGVESDVLGIGCIEVMLPADIVLSVQNGTALIAVVSK